MYRDFLVLYKPNVNISFHSNLYDLAGLLDKHGFKITTFEDRPPIYHGTAWITEMDEVVIHFNVTDKLEQLNSIMLTCGNKYEELVSSYQRRQKWLEYNYGNPQIAKENLYYGTFDYEWELPKCKIKHFIHDRFGDEEGIYIECIA
jgi:hypothetical protein